MFFELKDMKNCIVLLSGGLDSTTCLAIAKSQEYHCHTLSFDYAQRHSVELIAAKKIAALFEVASHHTIQLPTLQFEGHCALVDPSLDIPAYQPDDGIPITYVPARNTVFLSFALGLAEVLNANDIFIGVSSVDYSGYPDCRPAYIEAFQAMANLATKTAVNGQKMNIHAPLIHLSKAETIQLGVKLGLDYRLTISCYQANENGEACGYCDSCALRKKGFKAAEVEDQTHYQ